MSFNNKPFVFETPNQSLINLWVYFFLYTSLISIALQFIVLPFFFPDLHWGDGLLKGTDAVLFHQIAKEKAMLIRINGWSCWELSPSGHVPVGIASLFYALTTPKPLVLIPLFSAFHAGSAIILYKIFRLIFNAVSTTIISIAVIPFLIFPSAMSWYAQIHRDVFFIFGNLLILNQWLFLIRTKEREQRLLYSEIIFFGVGLFFSYFLISISRSYWIIYLTLFSVMCLIILLIWNLKTKFAAKKDRAHNVFQFFFVAAITIFIGIGFFLVNNPVLDVLIEKTDKVIEKPTNDQLVWIRSHWIPDCIDAQFQKVANYRQGFINQSLSAESGTDIDTEICFYNVFDIILYLPRALYIGFFMPTTGYTFKKGYSPGGTFMRWVTGFEMLFIYGTYPFMILAICLSQNKKVLLFVFCWSISAIVLFALVTTNIGTLYRFRYGFLMVLSCMGVLQSVIFVTEIKNRLSRNIVIQ